MSEAEMLAAVAERAVAKWRSIVDVGDVQIAVQIGDVSAYSGQEGALGFTAGSPDGKSAIIAIDPKAAESAAGIEHIVLHEMIHVAHGVRFPNEECKSEAFEWVVDELAYALAREHERLLA